MAQITLWMSMPALPAIPCISFTTPMFTAQWIFYSFTMPATRVEETGTTRATARL